jgi:hypothetical protein
MSNLRYLQRTLARVALVIGLSAYATTSVGGKSETTAVNSPACASCPADQPGPRMVDDSAAQTIVLLCGAMVVLGCGSVLTLVLRAHGDARARRWRLTDALSEDVAYSDEAGHSVTLLTASASRLIAVLGLIVILSMYIGLGLLTLHAFAVGKATPSAVETMLKFLAGGAGLFLPYLANQLRAGLEKKVATTAVTGNTDKPKVEVPPLPEVPKGASVD